MERSFLVLKSVKRLQFSCRAAFRSAPAVSSSSDISPSCWRVKSLVTLSYDWFFPRSSLAVFCTPLFSTWSSKWPHSLGAKYRLWQVSSNSSGLIDKSTFFISQLFLLISFSASSVTRSLGVVAAFSLRASCTDFFFFSKIFRIIFSCVFGQLAEFGPPLFVLVRLTANLSPHLASGSCDVTIIWLCWNLSLSDNGLACWGCSSSS